ncbi:Tnf receptor-associated factor 2 [Mactra antiquata]
MATAGVANGQGGYPKEIFKNSVIDEKYLCNFCGLVLREPVQSFCGHRFCRSCIDSHIRTGNQIRCTQCEKEPHDDDESDFSIITEDQIFPDNAIKREMGRLDIHCPYTGCTWAGKFRLFEEHLDICDFKPVQCPQCGQLINKEKLETHKVTDCRMACNACGQLILYSNMANHVENECPKMTTVCEICGRQGIVREELEAHQQTMECQAGEIECPVGCGLIPRKNFHDHFNQKRHSLWLIQKLDELSQVRAASNNEVDVHQLQSKILEFDGSLRNLREEFSRLPLNSSGNEGNSLNGVLPQIREIIEGELSTLSDSIDVKTGTFEGIASALHRELEKTITAVEKLEQHRIDTEQKIERVHTKLASLERTVALKEMNMAELELRAQSMEAVSYDGTFMWRVSEFSKKHQDAVSGRTISIYSSPFYSSRRGYKMCARLYPNGDGMGKGSHLSLFFVVMRGNYDALLQWPFTRRVTFCIVNQSGGEHVIDSFRPDPQSSSFKRPTSDMNIASGCPLFIRLEMLNNPNNGFLKDDTMFLKISVDVSELTDPISSLEDRVKPQM